MRPGKTRTKARTTNGSVLVLVIVLLVLMALIGTAFISTARVDRYSATQNTYNTQADLLVQGTLAMAQGQMIKKLQPGGAFRQASSAATTQPTTAYAPFESVLTDTYLADRIPYLWNAPWLASGTTTPAWAYVSAPVTGTVFEGMYAVYAGGSNIGAPLDPSILPRYYTSRTNLVPAAISVPQPDGSTKLYPAFTYMDSTSVNGQTPTNQPITVLAADTDGDGIADAGFVRLPGGTVEGATWYAAVRIIDNCAAINASVAMEPNSGTNNQANFAVPGDLFPVNVNLRDQLISGSNGDNWQGFNAYRFNETAGASGTINSGNGIVWSTTPVDDSGAAHSDFAFVTPYEAAWMQLGSRLNNPGFNTAGTSFQSLPINEGMALAYHFCLLNQNALASPVLESLLPATVGSQSAANRPAFSPDQAGTQTTGWFGANFNYATNGAAGMPLRPILVARNPVSSFVPNWFRDEGVYAPSANYQFGDRVQFSPDPTTGQLRGFVCISSNPAIVQGSTTTNVPPVNSGGTYNNAVWAAMPWTAHPTKINANTGTFGQLWAAYWSVMQDSPDAGNNYPNGSIDWTNNGTTDVGAHQFRSAYRGGSGTFTGLTRSQMLQLRAALAAVNTIDMRDGDEDVTSRTITLTSAGGATVLANVYGSEKSPYITEVLVDYNGAGASPTIPYVAVELYNPHPTPIPLTGWKIATVTRAANLTLTEAADLATTLAGASPPHVSYISPGERIVLQSDPGNAPASVLTQWSTRTPPFNPPTAQTAGGSKILVNVVGTEMVLLRPRLAAGTLSKNSAAENTFDETNGLTDLVPVDQVDLTGIPAPTDSLDHRYRYARANRITTGTDSAAWHCVFPGPYNVSPSGTFRQMGLAVMTSADPNWDGGFGLAKGLLNGTAPSATYETRPLQINNRDSAGPNRPYIDLPRGADTAGSGITANGSVQVFGSQDLPAAFPFGGFARNGDLLQVPFIGGYKIYSVDSSNNVTLLELNSVTVDSVLAQYQDPTYNITLANGAWDADTSFTTPFHNEQIGHFCPMDSGYNDLLDDSTHWAYHWAKQLFDYVAVYTPQDGYLPNVDPALTTAGASGDPSLASSNPKYIPSFTPMAVSSNPNLRFSTTQPTQQFQGRQDAAGTDGLININTAGWKVLSALPFYAQSDSNYLQDNASMANAIWTYRETLNNTAQTGPAPFRSIFDLMKVPRFKGLSAYYASSPGEAGNASGDLSPFGPTLANSTAANPPTYTPPGESDPTDHVFGDVKTRFLGLQRISNLITTRSDSFTVYAQVQGWQNVGTPAPTLIATRRAAVLIDRSQVKPVRPAGSGTITTTPMGATNVPND